MRSKYLVVFLLFLSSIVRAEILDFTGSVHVKNASFSTTVPSIINAYSGSYTISMSNNTPALCALTSAKTSYNSPKTDCEVVWGVSSLGTLASDASVSGTNLIVTPTHPAETYSIPYVIVLRPDGTTASESIISSGTVSFDAGWPAPIGTPAVHAVTELGASYLLDNSTLITNSAFAPVKVRISVPTRLYSQVFSIDGAGGCTVLPGQTNCEISVSFVNVGVEYATSTYALHGNPLEDAVNKPHLFYDNPSAFKFEYDFRPPLSSTFAITLRQGASSEYLTPSVQNLRAGEAYTIVSLAPNSYGTVTLDGSQKQIKVALHETTNRAFNVGYTIQTNHGRSFTAVGKVSVVADQQLSSFSIPVVPNSNFTSSFIGFDYVSTIKAQGSSGLLTGLVPLVMSSDAASPGNVYINGQLVTPGSQHGVVIEFDANGVPVLDLRVDEGAEAISGYKITLDPTDTSLGRIKINASTHKYSISHSIPASVSAFVEGFTGTVSSNCRIVAEADFKLQGTDCVVDWVAPASLSVDKGTVSGIFATAGGNVPIGYSVWTKVNENKIVIGSWSGVVNVSDVVFNFGLTGLDIQRESRPASISLEDLGGSTVACIFYTADEPVENTFYNLLKKRLYCRLEWIHYPEGLVLRRTSTPGELVGSLVSDTDISFQYRITAMMPGGDVLTLADKTEVAVITAPSPIEYTMYDVNPNSDHITADFGSWYAPVLGLVSGSGPIGVEYLYKGESLGFVPVRGSGIFTRLIMPPGINTGDMITVDLRIFYVYAPEISISRQETVVVRPTGSLWPYVNPNLNYNDIDSNTVEAAMRDFRRYYRYRPEEFIFDESVHGKWNIQLMEYNRLGDEIYTPASENIRADAEGKARFNVDLDIYEPKYYVTKAELIANSGGGVLETRITSAFAFNVLKKSLFEGELTSYATSGAVPFRAYFRYFPDNKVDYWHIKRVEWQVNDGSGWETKHEAFGSRSTKWGYVFDAVGDYYVRAVVYNDLDVPTYSAQTLIQTYEIPPVEIEGQNFVINGRDAVYTATINGGDFDLSEWDVEWVYNGEIVGSDKTLTLNFPNQNYGWLTAYVARKGIEYRPELARGYSSKRIYFGMPHSISASLNFDAYPYDLGDSYDFVATPAEDVWGLTTKGRWTGSDGSIVDGFTMSDSYARRDIGYKWYNFEIWYDEFPEIRRSYPLRVLVQSQFLPEMKLGTRYGDITDFTIPVVVDYFAYTDDVVSRYEFRNMTFEWDDGGTGAISYSAGGHARIMGTSAGSVTLTANISNQFGDTQSVSKVLNFNAPPDLVYSIAIVSPYENMTYPSWVYVAGTIENLQYGEKITEITAELDGEPTILRSSGAYFKYLVNEPGVHSFKLSFSTSLGRSSSDEVSVETN